nr:MAG TPA: hypothetical protein [Caudoviricetes sp.]
MSRRQFSVSHCRHFSSIPSRQINKNKERR